MEAWDAQFKNNLDWNHAWGSAPANIIPRRLMGVEPIEPGWRRMRIKPQPGSLEWADMKLPTIQGDVQVNIKHNNGDFLMDIEIPSHTKAEVHLPCPNKKHKVYLNGELQSIHRNGHNAIINVEGGKHSFRVTNAD